MAAKTIQICGTGSGVGKSIITSALCRILLQDGYRVCPFKAQNMALNSFVTKDGGEIGRAQATQAQACKIEPTTDMNPVLIKPSSNIGAQIIVQGKPIGNMSAKQYQNRSCKTKLFKKIKESFNRLKKKYEIIIIEGAGSPAEVNLKKHDIVNMKMAKYAQAPVLLVGDIDKGGVFASLVGTLALLNKYELKQISGFIINKFRGDKELLKQGITFLEKSSKKKVVGIIPYFPEAGKNNINIPEEDSANLKDLDTYNFKQKKVIKIAVIHLPHISNFTDFDKLEKEPDVQLKYIRPGQSLDHPDVIIIPGSKNTISDLRYIKKYGMAQDMLSLIKAKPSTRLIGICGGYQMLGQKISDPDHIESLKKEIDGLGILPIFTRLKSEKILSQIKAQELSSGLNITGYEIHHGQTLNLKKYKPVLKIIERQGQRVEAVDGTMNKNGTIWGTYVHGIFDEDLFRRNFLNRIRLEKKWPPLLHTKSLSLEKEFDRLADLVRRNIDLKLLYKILHRGL